MLRALLLALVIASPALARDPVLMQPLICTLGEDCFILNYVDADPGPGAADFTCGPRSYDGHQGTDFAVLSFDAMRAGVPVRPVSPGVVTHLRDGMPDAGMSGTPSELLANRDCGNGVLIDHGNGWSSQYCHLKNGSIAVKKGQRVSLATTLGDVGFSGRTQFPHVHVTVRSNGKVVDPFNTDQIISCGGDDGPEDDLWGTVIPYDAGRIFALGMATEVPDYEALKAGAYRERNFPPDAPALVGWGLIAGGRANDEVEIEILFPDRSQMIRDRVKLEKTQAMLFRAAGKGVPEGGWPSGEYVVGVRLIRDGKPISLTSQRIMVGN
ncbi:M23 family metallopeptidase [Maritimibacter dapengensis]|uniref:M23 family metallopeptidase n=1 Tax=Maritimibacter dapengensis TaxID=2836868 RepID=A0ABS6SY53_9RHOB|nr:M23 family metallopeptidase [Maritimibacter dapengensis]MBV7377655.1 M23 family metallopeptidase [Maritimibacter dapengensis]